MPPDPTAALPPSSLFANFRAGVAATTRSVLFYVLFGSYLGIGALAHDLGFSLGWTLASTVLVWAAPARKLANGGDGGRTAVGLGGMGPQACPIAPLLVQ